MRTVIYTETLYRFEELSEQAQEVADMDAARQYTDEAYDELIDDMEKAFRIKVSYNGIGYNPDIQCDCSAWMYDVDDEDDTPEQFQKLFPDIKNVLDVTDNCTAGATELEFRMIDMFEGTETYANLETFFHDFFWRLLELWENERNARIGYADCVDYFTAEDAWFHEDGTRAN